MRQCTLIHIFNPQWQILLNMKKRGFWEGKYNWAWGKVEIWETILASAKRELFEETGVIVEETDFEPKGIFHFFFPHKPEWDQDVHFFIVRGYTGAEPKETEEMRPMWFDIHDIPYDRMWPNDVIWIPRILSGESVEYNFLLAEDGNIISFDTLK